jgi:hypothetical protein
MSSTQNLLVSNILILQRKNHRRSLTKRRNQKIMVCTSFLMDKNGMIEAEQVVPAEEKPGRICPRNVRFAAWKRKRRAKAEKSLTAKP